MIEKILLESSELKKKVSQDDLIITTMKLVVDKIINSLINGGKIMLAGNGGSASDALHMAGEFVGRFLLERKGYAAISLNSDIATMTAIGNDYGFDKIYSRQIEALAKKGDIFWCFSTSGNSKNIIQAMVKSNEIGVTNILFSGNDGGEAFKLADYSILVPSSSTARIQEVHILLGHIICELVEKELKKHDF